MSSAQQQPAPAMTLWKELWGREFRLNRRFSVGIVLGWMTLAAMAFGICEWLHAPIRWYVRVLSLGAATIVFQFVLPRRPRTACAWAGLFVSLAWVVPQQSFWAPFGTISISGTLTDIAAVALFGALVGYLVGAIATGIPVLIADLLRLHSATQDPVDEPPWGDVEPAVPDGPHWSAATALAQRRRAERHED